MVKTVVEYIDLAQNELDQPNESDKPGASYQQHVMRAQVYATLAVAKATSDKP
jgi:hypothetical protein